MAKNDKLRLGMRWDNLCVLAGGDGQLLDSPPYTPHIPYQVYLFRIILVGSMQTGNIPDVQFACRALRKYTNVFKLHLKHANCKHFF